MVRLSRISKSLAQSKVNIVSDLARPILRLWVFFIFEGEEEEEEEEEEREGVFGPIRDNSRRSPKICLRGSSACLAFRRAARGA